MYIIVFLVLSVIIEFSKCEQRNINLILNRTAECNSTHYHFKRGDSVNISIASEIYINLIQSEPAFRWTDREENNTYYRETNIKGIFVELGDIWRFEVFRSRDSGYINQKNYLDHNYTVTLCELEVKIDDEEVSGNFYLLIGVSVIAFIIIVIETIFLLLYITKVKNLKKTNIYKLENDVDTARYSKTPTQKKQSSDDRESNLYECLENVRIPGEKNAEENGPPLPPYPSPQAKIKLLASSSVNSTLEKPAQRPKAPLPVNSPKMKTRNPSPIRRRRCDSDGDETYQPPPDYRKSYTLPPRGLEPLDKKALINALMSRKPPVSSSRLDNEETNSLEKNVKSRPPLPLPIQSKRTERFLQPSSSTQNLIDTPKPRPKIPPTVTTKITPNNIESELAMALKRRRNVPAEEPKKVEQPRKASVPSNSVTTTSKPRQHKIQTPDSPPRPPVKPKNNGTPIRVQDTSTEDPSDYASSDEEWTYEPLTPYNIYSM